MELQMKQRFPVVMLSLLILAMSAASGRAQAGPCSNATLSGQYGFTVIGQILAGPAAGQIAGVALTSFDGQGHLSQVDHVLHSGNPPAVQWRPATGSYDLGSDCTGTMEIDFTDGSPSLNLSIVVVRRGWEIRTVVGNPGTAITSVGIKRDSLL